MRFRTLLVTALAATGVASCGENAPPSTQTEAKLLVTSNSGAQTNAAAQSPAGKRVAADLPPVPPKGAQWTLLCDTVDGPAHVEEAGILKARLIQTSGMADWYVLHSEKESTIYYGYYRSLDNPAEKQRADTDRLKISMLHDRLNNRMVRGGVLVAITPPDPVAPPEWNLLNARKDAYWTIEIATFAGDLKRKEAAVQAVRELREKGETEAYYYHGPTASSVCIGAWPRSAVMEQGTGIDSKGNLRDDAHSQNPDQPLLVYGDVAPPNLRSRIEEPGTGKAMAVLAPKLDIQDPDMKKKVADYPNHYVNYELRGVQHDGQTFPDPSVLVAIPRDSSSTASDNDYLLSGGPPAPETRRPSPSSAGDNVLRSIGDK